MKSIAIASVALLGALASSPVWAGCAEPPAVTSVPSGATASRDDMVAAQRAIKAYDTAVKEFTDCLQKSGDTSNKEGPALDQLHKIADKFNEELRTFKQKNGA